MVMELTDRDDAVWYAQGKYYFVTAVELQTCTCFSLKAWTLDEQDGEAPASTGHTTKDLLVLLAQIRMELRQSHANTPGVGPLTSNHGEGNSEASSILAGRSLLATVEADTVFRLNCF